MSTTDWRAALREYLVERHEETWPVLVSLRDEDLGRRVHTDQADGWTVGQLLAHLADAEIGLLSQAKRLSAGQAPVPEDFDIDRWNRGAVRRKRATPAADLLQEILTAHREALAFVDSLQDAQRALEGRGSGRVLRTTEGFLHRIGEHRAEHTAEIRSALQP
jgi:hypothetical protein